VQQRHNVVYREHFVKQTSYVRGHGKTGNLEGSIAFLLRNREEEDEEEEEEEEEDVSTASP
jgi:hypothetical protein